MRKRTLFALLAALATVQVFAEAYTWTDDEGVVHFSDKPHPGATVLDLGETTAPRPPVRRADPVAPEETAVTPANAYTNIEIASPAAEETLWNIGETINVRIVLAPGLKEGHQLRVYFDGTPRIVSGTNFQIQEVYRGIHNMQAEVIDDSGQMIVRSESIRFYVQQNSVL